MSDEIKGGTGERGLFYWNPETKKMERVPYRPRKVVNAPYVIRDEIIGGIQSQVTGRIYDSKSNLRREYKAMGVIEKGNDRMPRSKPPSQEEIYRDIREDVEKAYYDLKYDRVPVSEKEKQQCQEELRRRKKF